MTLQMAAVNIVLSADYQMASSSDAVHQLYTVLFTLQSVDFEYSLYNA